VNAILSSDYVAASEFDTDLPAALEQILGKALEKDRELRYQTASDLRADLKRLRREIDSSPSWSGSGSSRRRARERVAATAHPRQRRWLWPIAVGLVLLTVVSLILWQLLKTSAGAPDWSRARHTQLTDQAGTEFYPSLSPDGKSFVYSSNQDGNFDVYVQRVGGKNPTNLTKDSPANDKQPAFSTDGERIAFWFMPPGVGRSDIATVAKDGGEPMVLTKDASTNWNPVWSPDGKKLAAELTHNNVNGLGYFSFETNRYEKLADIDTQPMWLPDSRHMVFISEGKAFIFDTQTKKMREISPHPTDQLRSVFVSRDSRLLYYTVQSSESDIWLLSLE